MSTDSILGFDFGINHIGVAVGTCVLKVARPLKTIRAKDGKVVVKADMDALFKDYMPKCIVVGMPLNMDGTMQDMSYRARKFGNRLSNDYRVPVIFQDERLSSADAKATLFDEYGFKGLKSKDNVDAMAASVILQSYFDNLQDDK